MGRSARFPPLAWPLFFPGIGHNGRMRQVLMYRRAAGFRVAECRSLPGCVTQGETRDSAPGNIIKDAIQACVDALEADKLPVPEDHFEAQLVTVDHLPVVSGRECGRAPEQVGLRLI